MKVLPRLPFRRRIARALGSRLFHWAENNSNCEITRNGESWLLQTVFHQWSGTLAAAPAPRVVFDVGANIGDFSAAVLAAADRWKVPVRVLAQRRKSPRREMARAPGAGR